MLTTDDLRALDVEVNRLARDRASSELVVLGAGELTCVVEWRGHACKRLPAFRDPDRVDAYETLLERYIERLEARGLGVVPTSLGSYERSDGRISVYVVQPKLNRKRLLSEKLHAADTTAALALFAYVLDAIDSCVTGEVGLDAQVTNWAVEGSRLLLLDVATPLMRDGSGEDLLDTEVFVAALPAFFRPVVRALFVSNLLDRFFDPRAIVLDTIANLGNVGLDHFSEAFLEAANARLTGPITMDEIDAYRRREAFTWALIRRALLVEQAWQRKVMRTEHPTLLPFEFR